MDILSHLVERGVIDKNTLPEVEAQLQKPGTSLEAVLVKQGAATKDILKAKGEYFGIPTRELKEGSIPFDTLRFVPEESARHYRLAPLDIEDGVLEVGITDHDNLEARDALTFISAKVGMPYKVFLISDADFEKLLQQYKGLSGEVGKALTELETELAVDSEKEE